MTEIDVVTGEVVSDLPADEARDLTEQIALGLAGVWHLVKQAYEGRAWIALGYGSWDDYCTQEFGQTRIRLPREERQEVVASLREAGLSIRAIAAGAGISPMTVQSDLEQVYQSGTPADETDPLDQVCGGCDNTADRCRCEKFDAAARFPDVGHEPDDVEPRFKTSTPKPSKPPVKSVTGLDGKKYTGSAQPKPKADRRPPLIDQVKTAGWDLNRAIERLQKLAADDRYPANKPQVAVHLHGHLTTAIAVCQDLLDGITNGPTEAQ